MVARRFARAAAGIGLVAGSALLLAASAPPGGIAPLAWVALAPFFVVLRRAGTGAALLLAWGWCLLYAWGIASALPRSIADYYAQGLLIGWLYALGLWTAMAAFYYMGFAWTYRRLATRLRGPLLPLLVAAAWTLFEFGRGRLFTGTPFFIGNPWGLVGYSQVAWSELAQLAALTGVYGIGFAVAAANAWLAELALGTWRTPRARLGAGLLAALPLALALVHGAVALRGADAGAARAPVAVVQGNFDNALRWRPEHWGENVEVYVRLSREATSGFPAPLVVWPENAVPLFLDEERSWRRYIAASLRPGARLLAGSIRREPRASRAPAHRYFNSMFLLDERGELVGRYDKELLVPFTEYFPIAPLDAQRRSFGAVRTFTHGTAVGALETPIGAVGVLTCNEAMLPEVAARRVADGATVLVSPANDGWIRDAAFADHMLAIVSLRAVEQRRWLIRASTSGPSAIVDPWGRIVARTRFLEQATLRGHVEARSERSPYGRVGDLFALACAGATLLALRVGARRPAGASIRKTPRSG